MKRNAPKAKKRSTFYYYSNSKGSEDANFEEFFKRAGGYSGNGSSSNGYEYGKGNILHKWYAKIRINSTL
jgi:hypothetical protein